MRRCNPDPGWLGSALMFTLMVLLIPAAQAFPLHGGNGMAMATVYGVEKYEYGNGLYVDISASDADTYEVEMIDIDNNTYGGDSSLYRSALNGFPTETKHNGSVRDMLLFDVPKDVIIKRLKITPSNSTPFYINWTGTPVVRGKNTTLRFYGADFEPNGMRWRQGNWNLDVNVTNRVNRTVEYNSSDFALVDQFGWAYPGEKAGAIEEIPAGGSLRFSIKVPFVSEISKPKEILFKGLEMDISAWV